jgi:hypothetical protein
MNLTPNSHAKKFGHSSSPRSNSARRVWLFLLQAAHQTNPPTKEFQVSRKEIQKGTGVGSLNTIDNALGELEAYGVLCRHSMPGSNSGQIYELLTLDENPIPLINRWHIAATLRQIADRLENNNIVLAPQQLGKWSKLTYQARRLIDGLR